MSVSINVLAVAVDDVFMSGCVVLTEWVVRPKAVSIDGDRLLFAVGRQESNRRFNGGFRWEHVAPSSPTICEDEHGWLVFGVRSTSARGQATRARRAVALAALESCLHVEFVNLDWAFEVWPRRVQCFLRALDAPVDRLYETSISTSSCLRLVLKRM